VLADLYAFAAGDTLVRIYRSNKSAVVQTLYDICFGSRTGTNAGITALTFFGLYDNEFIHLDIPLIYVIYTGDTRAPEVTCALTYLSPSALA